MNIRRLGVVVLLLVAIGVGWGQSPIDGQKPAPLTEQQKKRLEERDRLFAEARKQTMAGNLSDSVVALEKVVAIERAVLGPTHEKVAVTLDILASQHEAREEFAAADKAREEEVGILIKLYGKDHWRVTNARIAWERVGLVEKLDAVGRRQVLQADQGNRVVLHLFGQSKYKEALPLAEKVRSLRQKTLGESHSNYAASLTNLAELYRSSGEFRKALPLFEQAGDIFQKTLGETHPDYGSNLNNLAGLHLSRGDYGKALPLYEQAREITRKALGEMHPDYARSLNNLGTLYEFTGDFSKALSLYEQAHDIRKKTLGPAHPDFAISLQTLAGLYRSARQYDKALPLIQQACLIHKKTLPEDHPSYAASLTILAGLYRLREEYGKALPLLEQVRDIRRTVWGETHSRYAASLNNLGELHHARGEHDKALPLYERALEIVKNASGLSHPDYAGSLNNLAALHLDMGNEAKAARLAHEALRARAAASDTTFAAQHTRLRLQLLSDYSYFLDRYLSVALSAQADPAEVYDHVLSWKGVVTARQAEERIALQQPQLAPLLERLRQARAALSQVAQSPPRDPKLHADWIVRIRDREAEKDNLETELAGKSVVFRRVRRVSTVDVLAALPPETAFVDFLEFTRLTPAKLRNGQYIGEQRLMAFVLRKGSHPIVIELGKAQPIEEAVASWRTSGRNASSPEASARKLAELVWDPIRKHLGEAKSIYLSADGALAKFPFAALPGSKAGTFLLEELTFTHITSGRQLLELTDLRNDPKASGLLAVGALDFGKPVAEDQPSWKELPGTRLETQNIAAAFVKQFPTAKASQLLTGADIDVNRLRGELTPKDGPRPQYLHLATHGFFKEPKVAASKRKLSDGPLTQDELKRLYTFDRNPMLSSGLALSGANADASKGVLTAEEVMGLDLRGVELAVLSACETGLGKMHGAQGVQGLQLAFHAAGVRTLAVSLWQVDDAATSVLMEEFYANLWQRKMPRGEALRQAQLTVLKNPDKVQARYAELRTQLTKRGVSEGILASRGLGKAAPLPDGGVVEPGSGTVRRSPPSWWAAFLLSGDPGKLE